MLAAGAMLGMTLMLVSGMTGQAPAQALATSSLTAGQHGHGHRLQHQIKPAKVTVPKAAKLPTKSASQQRAETRAITRHSVRWPAAARLADSSTPASVDAPVQVHAFKPGTEVAGRVIAHSDLAKARIKGVAVALAPGASVGGSKTTLIGPTRVQVDYSSFADAYGAGWAGRLVGTAYPACVLTTPETDVCSRGEVLKTSHDTSAQTVTASVPTGTKAETVVVFAAAAASATGGGDYSALPLSESSSWSAGGESGAFSWSYPMSVPPGINGPAPTLGVSYSSQAADGRTGGTNNQTGPLGEGFSIGDAYVERDYVSCNDDGEAGKYDLCWKSDNATLVLDGAANRLVKADDGTWRLADDDGSRVEHLTSTATANPDNDHEYWVLTQSDGTKYYFGRVAVPQESGDTGAVWTTPVFGNDAGEPCHADTFAASVCDQAWRWQLSYVVDPLGNAMSEWYTPETNYYAATGGPRAYTRGGYRTEIHYGLRDDATAAQTAPDRVVFNNTLRCTGTSSECGSYTKALWPDTPYDAICAKGAACTGHIAPMFFSRYRLGSVTTQIYQAGAYENVDSWTFDTSFLSYGTADDSILWLNSITRKGLVGGTTALPAVKFTAEELANRIEGTPGAEGLTPLPRPRVRSITSETGGVTTVNYEGSDCTSDNLMAPDANTRRCFPQRWIPPGYTNPVTDWFDKYLVASVVTADTTGLAQDVTTSYDYSGGAGWAYNYDKLIPEDNRTWSVWRGYARVTTTVGDPSAAASKRSQQVATYFRGLDGDKQTDGTPRDVSVTDSAGHSYTDARRLAGMLLETETLDGAGGGVVSGTINTPWTHLTAGTAGTQDAAFFVGTATTETREKVSAAETGTGDSQYADGYRREKVTTTYDTATGQPTRVSDTGDENKTGDEICTATTYADVQTTSGAWFIGYPTREVTSTGTCGDDALSPSKTKFISEDRTSYDNKDPGTHPSAGLVTKTERVDDYTDDGTGTLAPHYQTTSTGTYDKYGRSLTVTTPVTVSGTDKTTTTKTVYTPTDGLVTSVASTIMSEDTTKAQTTTTTLAPERGLATLVTDANNHRTRSTYDPLGRPTQTWAPNRSDSNTPSATYAYTVSATKPSAVVTKTLDATGEAYRAASVLYDSLQRPRESQVPSPLGGRIISTTSYDTRGLAYEQAENVYATGDPGSDFVQFEEGAIGTKTVTTFDGLQRPTKATLSDYNTTRWSSTQTYDGTDVTTLTPPEGGVSTTTRTDIRGRTVQTVEHGDASAATAAGRKDLTTSYAYNAKGDLAQVTSPAGTWTYDYDLLGRVVTSHDPETGDSRLTYTAEDQVATTLDARGQGTLTYYDAVGRPTSRYSITSTDQTKNNDHALATWTYDGLLKGMPDTSSRYIGGAGGQKITTSITGYNSAAQPTGSSITITNPTDTAGTKDPLPDDLSKILPTSLIEGYTHNVDGTPNTISLPKVNTSTAGTVLSTEVLNQDYDEAGYPTTLQGRTALIQNTDYDQLGRPTEYILGPGSDRQIYLDNEYDDGTNRLTRQLVNTISSNTAISDHRYTYDPAGNPLEDRDPVTGDTQCYAYDAHDRLTDAWTPTGSDGTECNKTPDPTAAPNDLLGALGGPAPSWQSWTFDTNTGNRHTQTTRTPTGSATPALKTVTDTYTYPAAGQAHANFATSITRSTQVADGTTGDTTQTLAYGVDDAGNTTARPDPLASTGTDTTTGTGEQALTWDSEGNLATLADPDLTTGADGVDTTQDAAGTTHYVYGTDGGLLVADGPTKVVLYDGQTQVTYDKTTKTLSAERDYQTVAGPIATRHGDADFDLDYLIPNAQGTAQISLDGDTLAPTRRWTTPYGETRSSTDGTGGSAIWPNSRGFLAAPTDADSGLSSLGARQYDSSTGRFISADPILDTSDPSQMLGYQYADNNPVTYADPSGLRPVDPSGNEIPVCHPGPDGENAGPCWTPSTGGGGTGGGSTGGGSKGGSHSGSSGARSSRGSGRGSSSSSYHSTWPYSGGGGASHASCSGCHATRPAPYVGRGIKIAAPAVQGSNLGSSYKALPVNDLFPPTGPISWAHKLTSQLCGSTAYPLMCGGELSKFSKGATAIIEETWDYGQAGIQGCDIICFSITFQGGNITAGPGAVGVGRWGGYLGAATAKSDDQEPLAWGACGAFVLGACASKGKTTDGRDWYAGGLAYGSGGYAGATWGVATLHFGKCLTLKSGCFTTQ